MAKETLNKKPKTAGTAEKPVRLQILFYGVKDFKILNLDLLKVTSQGHIPRSHLKVTSQGLISWTLHILRFYSSV